MKKLRAMVISDISCVGRCSLTAALPIVSAGGIECNIIPTAVLSTQTSGFEGYTYLDFTEQMLPIAKHWKSLGLKFDAIVTGFLGSVEQMEIVSEIIDMFKTEDTLVIVDPIMGDNGHLYSIYPDNYPKLMKELSSKADIITPNVTEASLLVGREHPDMMSKKDAIAFAEELSELGFKKSVITGIRFGKNKIGSICTKGKKHEFTMQKYYKGFFHGAGDVYSGAFVSCLLNGKSLAESNDIASEFTARSIKATVKMGTETRYGLEFEKCIPFLVKKLE